MTDLTVKVSKTIEAPISKVFDAWLAPSMLAKFMLPMPGMECPQVENNAIEGGAFTIVMQVGENKIPHTGKYLEINRPARLVFTWGSPESVDGSTVSLNFSKLSDSQTNIELIHEKFIDEQRRANHEGGWSNILQALNDALVLES